jgi:hypothetical protein
MLMREYFDDDERISVVDENGHIPNLAYHGDRLPQINLHD